MLVDMFFISLQYTILQLPDYFDWKQLKDLVRHVLETEPGWTDTIVQPSGHPGFCGYLSVKTETDAEQVWSR